MSISVLVQVRVDSKWAHWICVMYFNFFTSELRANVAIFCRSVLKLAFAIREIWTNKWNPEYNTQKKKKQPKQTRTCALAWHHKRLWLNHKMNRITNRKKKSYSLQPNFKRNKTQKRIDKRNHIPIRIHKHKHKKMNGTTKSASSFNHCV